MAHAPPLHVAVSEAMSMPNGFKVGELLVPLVIRIFHPLKLAFE